MTEASASVGLLLATPLVTEFLVDIEKYFAEKRQVLLFPIQQTEKKLANRLDNIFRYVSVQTEARFLDSSV